MFTFASFPPVTPTHDLAFYLSGKPTASEVLYRHIVVREFFIPAGMTNSIAKADIAATAEAVISCKKNGTQFGTITFGAGSNTGTLAASSLTTFTAGDILSLHAPASQDTTLQDLMITLAGNRS